MGAPRNGKILAKIAIAAFFGLTVPAMAEMDAKTFLGNYDRADQANRRLYARILGSFEGGMAWANSDLNNQGAARLYCSPAKMALTDEQIVDILRRFTVDRPDLQKYPYGLALLFALKSTFPCP